MQKVLCHLHLKDTSAKIYSIKALRAITGGGLKECKDLFEDLSRVSGPHAIDVEVVLTAEQVGRHFIAWLDAGHRDYVTLRVVCVVKPRPEIDLTTWNTRP